MKTKINKTICASEDWKTIPIELTKKTRDAIEKRMNEGDQAIVGVIAINVPDMRKKKKVRK